MVSPTKKEISKQTIPKKRNYSSGTNNTKLL
jgi:hypothetical protein